VVSLNGTIARNAFETQPFGNLMADTVAKTLAKFIHEASYVALPRYATDTAKACLLDALAVAYAARTLAVPTLARKFIGNNPGQSTIIGETDRVTAVDAAFVNATLINGCTHDDFLYKSHPGAVVIPAALAIANAHQSTGQELLTAIVMGYELVARAYLGGPGMLPAFRATGVAGVVGAAAAAAKALHLTPEQIAHALGCSAMFASGFGEGFRSGTMEVKLNVGWAARSGVSAALLAQAGATASPTIFEGESGYYQAFSRTANQANAALIGLGERYFIEDTVYKERPICIFVQTPVHLAHQLSKEHGIHANQIKRVTVRSPELTLSNPGFQNIAPYESSLKARISARFTVAAALLDRPINHYGYYENFNDGDVLALSQRIDLLDPHENQNDRVDLEITCEDDAVYVASGREMDTLKPTLPKVIAKYRHLTTSMCADKSDRLLDVVLNLDQVKKIEELTLLLETQ
jgi:2-methylcitrate dehydratase PrpD